MEVRSSWRRWRPGLPCWRPRLLRHETRHGAALVAVELFHCLLGLHLLHLMRERCRHGAALAMSSVFFDPILPALYIERASRLRAASKPDARGAASMSGPYEAADVDAALASITMSRRKLVLKSDRSCSSPPFRTANSACWLSSSKDYGVEGAGNGIDSADAGADTCQ